MIADILLNWDKTELANILADKLADADDLVEAAGSAERVPAVAGKWIPPWRAIGYRVRTAC